MQARVEAGADSSRRETVWHGLLGWAEYHLGARTDGETQQRYSAIAAYISRCARLGGQALAEAERLQPFVDVQPATVWLSTLRMIRWPRCHRSRAHTRWR